MEWDGEYEKKYIHIGQSNSLLWNTISWKGTKSASKKGSRMIKGMEKSIKKRLKLFHQISYLFFLIYLFSTLGIYSVTGNMTSGIKDSCYTEKPLHTSWFNPEKGKQASQHAHKLVKYGKLFPK